MGIVGADGDNAKRPRYETPPPSPVEVHVGESVVSLPYGSSVQDALGSRNAVAARVDNVVVSLTHPLSGSPVVVEPVVLESTDGMRVLKETLKFLLSIAVHKCSPALRLLIGRPMGSAYFCLLCEQEDDSSHMPLEEELDAIQHFMERLISDSLPIKTIRVARKVATDHFESRGAVLTTESLKGVMEAQVQLVECCDVLHLPRFTVAANTGIVQSDSFKLTPFKDGFLLEHARCDSQTGEVSRGDFDCREGEMLYTEYMERRQWSRAVDLHTISQLNDAVCNGRSKQIIQAVEANCDRQFVEIASKIKSRSDVKLILIAGPSSSGKTTFAKRMQVQLESLGFRPSVLSLDNYYKAWQDITTEGPQKVDWEALDSLNLDLLNKNLQALLSGEEALIPDYDMKISMPVQESLWHPMKLHSREKGVLIMEGSHCLNPRLTSEIADHQKFRISIAPIPALHLDEAHVLSGTSIRMLRRMVRDYLYRGRPVINTLRQWPAVALGELNNIFPHQTNADAVMNSEIAYEMCVLKVHAEPLLKAVPPSEPEYSDVQRLLHVLDQFIAIPSSTIPPQSLLREFVGGSWYYDFGGWYKSY